MLMPVALAGVEDLRARYREVLCAVLRAEDPATGSARCDAALHRMATEGEPTGLPVHLGAPRLRLRVGIVAGYGADCLAGFVAVLADAREHLAARGWPSESLHVEGLSSSPRNAAALRRAVLDAPLAPGERFVLVGYSKGAADMLEALARHPEMRPRVAAAVSLAGAVMGSPLADDPPRLLPGLVRAVSGEGCTQGDGGAFDSLRRTERVAFLARFPPADYGVPLYSLGAFAAPERTSGILRPMQRSLAFLDPRNDSQTLSTDQVVPGSALLG
ncbi:alpha/beta hydrolase [Falsiroseomonas oryziterrae]|uniref:alpha/beta hydrolase n=1 Tax=Falsiroseomonas oryziterrae TaxID=2911368 RepID=UPI001F1CA8F4|nr:alpha/beta hydrolase [Roseomonas sp. NPKOSM-4]